MSEILNVLDVNDYGLQSMKASGGGGEVNLQSKDITITENGTTTVTPDTGYDGLSDVDVTVSGILDTSDATAIPLNIKSGQTAYAKGEKITGTLPVLTYPIDPIDPSNWDYQFISADGSLKNVTRDGVDYITGGHTVVSNTVESWMFEGNSKMKMGFSHNKIASVAGLSANKLKKGETVLGVTGTYEGLDTSDATATASDMANGKTAYVNGVKITGNVEMVKSGNHALNTYAGLWSFPNPNCIATRVTFPQDYLCKKNSGTIAQTPYSAIASEVNLTPNKLKKGEKILGVTGTYEGTKAVLSDGIRFQYSTSTNFDWLANVDTSNITIAGNMFFGCSSLTAISLFNTSNVYNMTNIFANCTNLTTVPQLDTSSTTLLTNSFYGCSALSNESLNNILAMCTNSAATSSKTLAYIGLTQTQAQTCQTLSNWDAFVAARLVKWLHKLIFTKFSKYVKIKI